MKAAIVSAPSLRDRLLQLLHELGDEFVLGQPLAVAILVRRRVEDEAFRPRTETGPVGGNAGRGERAHRDAVVAHLREMIFTLSGLAASYQ